MAVVIIVIIIIIIIHRQGRDLKQKYNTSTDDFGIRFPEMQNVSDMADV